MRAFFLTLLLLVSSVASAFVVEELANNDVGAQFIRLINNSPTQWASCYYRDAYNYYTFNIAPNTYTAWQPIYGIYVWECRYY